MTPHQLAQRFLGQIKEIPGDGHHPFIQWCHQLCSLGPDSPDEVPWCSSFVNAICWMLERSRSKSAAARSWLVVGETVALDEARIGTDLVILKRGPIPQPGPSVLKAPGHVGFFDGVQGDEVWVLGGNQSNGVTRAKFPIRDILSIQRI